MKIIHLKQIPSEISAYVLKKQGEIKSSKGVGQFSLSKTILQLIKEHKEMSKK